MREITVLIHTCEHEALSAAVSEYSFRKYLHNNQGIKITTKIISLEDCTSWRNSEFRSIVRNGVEAQWDYHSPQAHLPLRFTISDYAEGVCLVVDPDVFAVRSFLTELLELINSNYVIQARPVQGGSRQIGFNSSVMIVNLAKLDHWNTEFIQRKVFTEKSDIQNLIHLTDPFLCPSNISIGKLDPCWNSYDKLNEDTILLHLTNQFTQPWKTGLPLAGKTIDNKQTNQSSYYQTHPNSHIINYFFNLLNEAVEDDFIDQEFLVYNIRRNFIRPDILSLLKSTSLNPTI